MGYTHYFEFKVPKGVRAAHLEESYRNALIECARIARRYNEECAAKGLEFARLSGYTAHTRPGAYGGLQLNGKGEYAHEPFELREHFKQNIDGVSYCKTDGKPYDTVIAACLAVLKYRLGDAIDVRSDGNAGNWVDGVLLARRVLRRKVPNPIGNMPRKDKLRTFKVNF
jgi:hypothetical protein